MKISPRLSGFVLVSIAVMTSSPASHAGDWLRFRGPHGSGVSPDKASTPTTWSATENLKWKTKLPGPGLSCPIVVGDKIFVTCYSGYGVNRRDPGDMSKLKRHLVCVDRKTGKILWDKTVKAYLPEDPFRGAGVPEHGYASHTPVSDGKNVYVFFGKSGALAFDLNGKQLWQKSAGTGSDRARWGSSSSPILYKNLLIVTASAENQAMVAFDTKTGKEVWKTRVNGLANVWGTPILVKIDDKRTDLVVGVPYEIWGMNPVTGKLKWYSNGPDSNQFNSSVIAVGKTVFAVQGGRGGGGSIAVKAGGKGDVTKTNVLWTNRDASRFPTPVVYDGRLYAISNNTVNCFDAKTGKRLFRARLQGSGNAGGGRRRGRRGGSEYSSPIIADGKLYYVSRGGNMFVLKAVKKFEQLAVNRVADGEEFSATPAASDGELFFRSSKHLYCIGEKKTEKK